MAPKRAPRGPQEGPKRTPRGPQEDPKRAPRWLQETSDKLSQQHLNSPGHSCWMGWWGYAKRQELSSASAPSPLPLFSFIYAADESGQCVFAMIRWQRPRDLKRRKNTAVNKCSRERVDRNGRSSRHGEVATSSKTWRAEAAMAKMRTPRAEPRFAREVRLGSPRGCSFSHHCMNKGNYIISSAKRGRGTLQRRAGMNHPDNDKKEKNLKCHGTVAVYR